MTAYARFRRKGSAGLAAHKPKWGRNEGNRENQLEDVRAAGGVAGAVLDSGSGRAAAQSVALLRDLRGGHRRPDPGIHAGRRHRPDRADACRHLRLCRAGSQQGAALDARRLLRKHGVADRRRLRVLDRLPQERAWPQAGDIVVCHAGKGEPGDITFVGPPTPVAELRLHLSVRGIEPSVR